MSKTTSSVRRTQAASAGKGHPYWYEWSVGLLQVIELLDPDGNVSTVTFQATGIKGWDDVVVRRKDGSLHLFQVKHTRIEDTFTYGDLVGVDEEGRSLLGELAGAWHALGDKPKGSCCTLFTNRTIGVRASKAQGSHRPSLEEFYRWLKTEVSLGKDISECVPPTHWADAWKEWTSALAIIPTSEEQTNFTKAFSIDHSEPDLREIEGQLVRRLAELFQVEPPRASALVPALDHALRRWATDEETVTHDDLLSALALNDEVELARHAPPPPTPFFPSRVKDMEKLEMELRSSGAPVVFLSACPGAGKTSLISSFTNRRLDDALGGVIGLRYFAFHPLQPGSALIAPDSDQRVKPDRLWYDLLSQLRHGLRGQLARYKVPVRNQLLRWDEARGHVLRIASELGNETGRPFVIAIDGIDHAARAARTKHFDTRDFFSSIPTPEELKDFKVRVLIAGQPASSYPEYPTWIARGEPDVRVLQIGQLESEDVQALLLQTNPALADASGLSAAELIRSATGGNTLSVVFATHEAKACRTVEELSERLTNRRIGAQLDVYYREIWSHALHRAAHDDPDIETALAGILCLAEERVDGELLAAVFPGLNRTQHQWQGVLARLEPLIISEAGKFRVMHNDVRTFLHGLLETKSEAERQLVTSALANYYLTPRCNRPTAHRILHRLLKESGREREWARVFSVDFVFEAAALDVDPDIVRDGAVAAVHQSVELRDWDVLQAVACALETLSRWDEWQQTNDVRGHAPAKSAPSVVPSELRVVPTSEWNSEVLSGVFNDISALFSSDANDRAVAVSKRWFSGLSLASLSSHLTQSPQDRLGPEDSLAEQLGRIACKTGIDLAEAESNETTQKLLFHFEQGWQSACEAPSPEVELTAFFHGRIPRFLAAWETAAMQLADAKAYTALRELLERMAGSTGKLSFKFRVKAVIWASISGASSDPWLPVLSETGIAPHDYDTALSSATAFAHSLGWTDSTSEVGSVTAKVLERFPSAGGRSEISSRIVLNAAVCLSRLQSLTHRRGTDFAADIVTVRTLEPVLSALWSDKLWGDIGLRERAEAERLCQEMVSAIYPMGGEHLACLIRACESCIATHVVDQRLLSTWDLLRREGDVPRRRAWIEAWLGQDGLVWNEASSEAHEIFHSLEPLGQEVGMAALLEQAAKRLSWQRISHVGHKDYSFGTPANWLEQLVMVEPESWRDLGVRLWSLSDAASASGCDNREARNIDGVLGVAAFKCGADDVRRLVQAEQPNERDDSWMHSTRSRLLAGANSWVETCSSTLGDRLAVWSLLLGYSRWFEPKDVADIAQLRDRMLKAAGADSVALVEALHRLTPSEAVRNRPQCLSHRDTQDGDGTSAADENVDVLRTRLQDGHELKPSEAAKVIADIRTRKTGESITLVLLAIGTGEKYGTVWSWYDWRTRDALIQIASGGTADDLWSIVQSATRPAGVASGWQYAIARNLQEIALVNARLYGGRSTLKRGLERLIHMHECWLRGGEKTRPLSEVILPSARSDPSWVSMVAGELQFLLHSHSAEVLGGALHGLQVLCAAHDEAIPFILPSPETDLWVLMWSLLLAESLARSKPEAVASQLSKVELYLSSNDVAIRTQAWVAISTCVSRLGQSPVMFPSPPVEQSQIELRLPPRALFHSPERKMGSMRLVNREQVARSMVARLEATTEANLAEVLSEVAHQLNHSQVLTRQKGPGNLYWGRDMDCSSNGGYAELGNALDRFMRKTPLPASLAIRFAQGYLLGDDAWLLRSTPRPTANEVDWPDEAALRRDDRAALAASELERRLIKLALYSDLDAEEIVLAAVVRVASSQDDWCLLTWWEEGAPDNVRSRRDLPSTVTGRVFPLSTGEYWEHDIPAGERPLVLRNGSMQKLAHSTLDLYPTKMWMDEFGWSPSSDDPLVWLKDGRKVAWYERIHGPLRTIYETGQQRQPVLNRWKVTAEEWKNIQNSLGAVRLVHRFEHDQVR